VVSQPSRGIVASISRAAISPGAASGPRRNPFWQARPKSFQTPPLAARVAFQTRPGRAAMTTFTSVSAGSSSGARSVRCAPCISGSAQGAVGGKLLRPSARRATRGRPARSGRPFPTKSTLVGRTSTGRGACSDAAAHTVRTHRCRTGPVTAAGPEEVMPRTSRRSLFEKSPHEPTQCRRWKYTDTTY